MKVFTWTQHKPPPPPSWSPRKTFWTVISHLWTLSYTAAPTSPHPRMPTPDYS